MFSTKPTEHVIQQISCAARKQCGAAPITPDYHLGASRLALTDLGLGSLAFLLACRAAPALSPTSERGGSLTPLLLAALYALIFTAVAHVFGLHNPLGRRMRLVLVVKYLGVAALSVGLLVLGNLFVWYTRIGRHVLVYAFLGSVLLPIVVRLLTWKLSEERKRRVLVFGAGPEGRKIVSLVRTTGIPFDVVGFRDTDAAKAGSRIDGVPVRDARMPRAGCPRDQQVHEVVACGGGMTAEEEAQLTRCMLCGLQVSDYPTFIEKTFYKVAVEDLTSDWFLQLNNSSDYAVLLGVKRMLDLLVATIGLVLSTPLLLLLASLIKLESPGPAFYSQVRVGQFNRPFRMLKLRTMRTDAEKSGAQWAKPRDPRVTRIGRLLRLTRIDEIPQFINVLRGDMSFVGPRPERPEFVEQLAKQIPFFEHRHLLKPGITGWAQIHYPYGASVEDALNKLKYDLYYIKHASTLLDLQIVLRTAGAVMKGAR